MDDWKLGPNSKCVVRLETLNQNDRISIKEEPDEAVKDLYPDLESKKEDENDSDRIADLYRLSIASNRLQEQLVEENDSQDNTNVSRGLQSSSVVSDTKLRQNIKCIVKLQRMGKHGNVHRLNKNVSKGLCKLEHTSNEDLTFKSEELSINSQLSSKITCSISAEYASKSKYVSKSHHSNNTERSAKSHNFNSLENSYKYWPLFIKLGYSTKSVPLSSKLGYSSKSGPLSSKSGPLSTKLNDSSKSEPLSIELECSSNEKDSREADGSSSDKYSPETVRLCKEEYSSNTERSSTTKISSNGGSTSKAETSSKVEELKAESFLCIDCDTFFNEDNFVTHFQNIHPDKVPFKCSVCSYGTLRRSEFVVHFNTHSDRRNSVRNASKESSVQLTDESFRCTDCDLFYNEKDFISHRQQKHSDKKPFKCSACSFQVAKSLDFVEHFKTHGDKRLEVNAISGKSVKGPEIESDRAKLLTESSTTNKLTDPKHFVNSTNKNRNKKDSSDEKKGSGTKNNQNKMELDKVEIRKRITRSSKASTCQTPCTSSVSRREAELIKPHNVGGSETQRPFAELSEAAVCSTPDVSTQLVVDNRHKSRNKSKTKTKEIDSNKTDRQTSPICILPKNDNLNSSLAKCGSLNFVESVVMDEGDQMGLKIVAVKSVSSFSPLKTVAVSQIASANNGTNAESYTSLSESRRGNSVEPVKDELQLKIVEVKSVHEDFHQILPETKINDVIASQDGNSEEPVEIHINEHNQMKIVSSANLSKAKTFQTPSTNGLISLSDSVNRVTQLNDPLPIIVDDLSRKHAAQSEEVQKIKDLKISDFKQDRKTKIEDHYILEILKAKFVHNITGISTKYVAKEMASHKDNHKSEDEVLRNDSSSPSTCQNGLDLTPNIDTSSLLEGTEIDTPKQLEKTNNANSAEFKTSSPSSSVGDYGDTNGDFDSSDDSDPDAPRLIIDDLLDERDEDGNTSLDDASPVNGLSNNIHDPPTLEPVQHKRVTSAVHIKGRKRNTQKVHNEYPSCNLTKKTLLEDNVSDMKDLLKNVDDVLSGKKVATHQDSQRRYEAIGKKFQNEQRKKVGFICRHCDIEFLNRHRFLLHARIHQTRYKTRNQLVNLSTATNETEGNTVKDPESPSSILSEKNLVKDEVSNMQDLPQNVDDVLSGRKLPTEPGIQATKEAVRKRKHFQCGQCAKEFNTRKRLRAHIPTHSKHHLKNRSTLPEHPLEALVEAAESKVVSHNDECSSIATGFNHVKIKTKVTSGDDGNDKILPRNASKTDKSIEIKRPNSPHLGVREESCMECGLTFHHRDLLVSHYQTVHGGKTLFGSLKPVKQQNAMLQMHIQQSQLTAVGTMPPVIIFTPHQKTLSCSHCALQFQSDSDLTFHLQAVHKQDVPNSSETSNGTKTGDCSKEEHRYQTRSRNASRRVYGTAQKKQEVIEYEHQLKPPKCVTCGYKAEDMADYVAHLQMHDQELKAKCFFCDERFLWDYERKKHMVLHYSKSKTVNSTTVAKTTVASTTVAKATVASTTVVQATVASTTVAKATIASTTDAQATVTSTAIAQVTGASATVAQATIASTSVAKATVASTTVAQDTVASTTVVQDTVASTTVAQDTVASTTLAQDTIASTTVAQDTVASTTVCQTIAVSSFQVDDVNTSLPSKHVRLDQGNNENKVPNDVVHPLLVSNSHISLGDTAIVTRTKKGRPKKRVPGPKSRTRGKIYFPNHVGGVFFCEKCVVYFATTQIYVAHQISAHGVTNPLKCGVCEYSTDTMDKLRSHNYRSHTYRCDICKLKFKSNYHLRLHRDTSHPAHTTYPCSICSDSFVRPEILRIHTRMLHGINNDISSSSGTLSAFVATPYECRLCATSFSKIKDWLDHETTCKELLMNSGLFFEDVYPCRVCKQCFSGIQAWLSHANLCKPSSLSLAQDLAISEIIESVVARAWEPQPEVEGATRLSVDEPTNDDKFESTVQHQVGDIDYQLEYTQLEPMIHSNESQLPEYPDDSHYQGKAIVCGLCDFETDTKHKLKRHLNVSHSKMERFECDRCLIVFTSRRYLRHHQQLHKVLDTPQDKLYACLMCNVNFPDVITLRRHKAKKSHRKIVNAPTKCGSCNKYVRRRDFLLHSSRCSAALNRCDHCSMVFSDLLSYDAHEKICKNVRIPIGNQNGTENTTVPGTIPIVPERTTAIISNFFSLSSEPTSLTMSTAVPETVSAVSATKEMPVRVKTEPEQVDGRTIECSKSTTQNELLTHPLSRIKVEIEDPVETVKNADESFQTSLVSRDTFNYSVPAPDEHDYCLRTSSSLMKDEVLQGSIITVKTEPEDPEDVQPPIVTESQNNTIMVENIVADEDTVTDDDAIVDNIVVGVNNILINVDIIMDDEIVIAENIVVQNSSVITDKNMVTKPRVTSVDESQNLGDLSLDGVNKDKEENYNEEYFCEECQQNFTYLMAFLVHRRLVHQDEKPLNCGHCPFRTHNLRELNNHKATHREIINKHLECRWCRKLFKSRFHRKVHEAGHVAGQRVMDCPRCNRKYQTAKELFIHLSTCYGGTFKCPHCSIRFSDIKTLAGHSLRCGLEKRAKEAQKSAAKSQSCGVFGNGATSFLSAVNESSVSTSSDASNGCIITRPKMQRAGSSVIDGLVIPSTITWREMKEVFPLAEMNGVPEGSNANAWSTRFAPPASSSTSSESSESETTSSESDDSTTSSSSEEGAPCYTPYKSVRIVSKSGLRYIYKKDWKLSSKTKCLVKLNRLHVPTHTTTNSDKLLENSIDDIPIPEIVVKREVKEEPKTVDDSYSNTFDGPDSNAFDDPHSNNFDGPTLKNLDQSDSKIFNVPALNLKHVEEPDSINLDIPAFRNVEERESEIFDAPAFRNVEESDSKHFDAPVLRTVEELDLKIFNIPTLRNVEEPESEIFDAPVSRNVEILDSKTFDIPALRNVEIPDSKMFEIPGLRNVEKPIRKVIAKASSISDDWKLGPQSNCVVQLEKLNDIILGKFEAKTNEDNSKSFPVKRKASRYSRKKKIKSRLSSKKRKSRLSSKKRKSVQRTEPSKTDDPVVAAFWCKECDLVCDEQDFVSHYEKVHPNKVPFQCSRCSYGTLLRAEFVEHFESNCGRDNDADQSTSNAPAPLDHQLETLADQDRPSYCCKDCTIMFDERDFAAHRRVVHKDFSPFKCSLCIYEARKRADFVNHLESHAISEEFRSNRNRKKGRKTVRQKKLLNSAKDVQSEVPENPSASVVDELFPLKRKLIFDESSNETNDSDHPGKRLVSNMPRKEPTSKHTIRKPKTSDAHDVFFCEECKETFDKFPNYIDHRQSVHDDDEPLKCLLCDYGTNNQVDLELHESVHAKEHTFNCTLCHSLFESMYNLLLHFEVHILGDVRPCELCNEKLPDADSLNEHWQATHNVSSLELCHRCKGGFKTRRFLIDHLSRCSGGAYLCRFCSLRFTDLQGWSSHAFECRTSTDYLALRDKSSTRLVMSVDNKGSVTLVREDKVNKSEGIDTCTIVKEKEKIDSSSVIDTISHRVLQTEVPKVEFSDWQKRWLRYTIPKRKQRTTETNDDSGNFDSGSSNSKSIAEQNSGKTKSEPALHELASDRTNDIHGNSTPLQSFHCTICASSFDEVAFVEHYALFHPGQMPFKCGQCLFGAGTRTEIVRHVETHKITGSSNKRVNDFAFRCQDCDQFFEEQKFVSHRRSAHQDETPFKCKRCEFATETKAAFVSHCAKHLREGALKCDFCDRYFANDRQRMKHMQCHFDALTNKQDASEETTTAGVTSLQKTFFHPEGADESRPTPDSVLSPLGNSDENGTATEFDDVSSNDNDMGDPGMSHFSDSGNDSEAEEHNSDPLNSDISDNLRNSSVSSPQSDEVPSSEHEERPKSIVVLPKTSFSESFANELERERDDENEADAVFNCDDCEQRFEVCSDFVDHRQLEHGDAEPLKCKLCEYGTYSMEELHRHKEVHRLKYTFECISCSYSFGTMYHLLLHLEVHMFGKVGPCEVCAENCGTDDSQNEHWERTHNIHKLELCYRCKARFKSPRFLIDHLSHCSGFPYQCRFCTERFDQCHKWTLHLSRCMSIKNATAQNDKTSMVPKEKTPMVPKEKTPMVPKEKTPMVPKEKTPMVPKEKPSMAPKEKPSMALKEKPSMSPKEKPSMYPKENPSMSLKEKLSMSPKEKPSMSPKEKPSMAPKEKPSMAPKEKPLLAPKEKPSMSPKEKPSMSPKEKPSMSPKEKPSMSPKGKPSMSPKEKPSMSPKEKPSMSPKEKPSMSPKEKPSMSPKEKPSMSPKEKPSMSPKEKPSMSPKGKPSMSPIEKPSKIPVAPKGKIPASPKAQIMIVTDNLPTSTVSKKQISISKEPRQNVTSSDVLAQANNPDNCSTKDGTIDIKNRKNNEITENPASIQSFRCKICDTFFVEAEFISHYRYVHADTMPFTCRKCAFGTLHRPELLEHLKTHAVANRKPATPTLEQPKEVETFLCKDCLQPFEEERFVAHRKSVHGDQTPFKCVRCAFKTDKRRDFVAHLASHPFEGSKCDFCERRFFTDAQRTKHMKYHSNAIDRKRPASPKSKEDFIPAKRIKGSGSTTSISTLPEAPNENVQKCLSEEKSSQDPANVPEITIPSVTDANRREQNTGKSLWKEVGNGVCVIAGRIGNPENVRLVPVFQFKSPAKSAPVAGGIIPELLVKPSRMPDSNQDQSEKCRKTSDHFKKCPEQRHSQQKDAQTLKCAIGKFGTKSENDVQRRLNVQIRTNTFKCTACCLSFDTMYHLLLHMEVHVLGILSPCEVCRKQYPSANLLRAHWDEVHNRHRFLLCHGCNGRYRSRMFLQAHLKRCSGRLSPYKCRFCSIRFHSIENWSRHIMDCSPAKSTQSVDRTPNEPSSGKTKEISNAPVPIADLSERIAAAASSEPIAAAASSEPIADAASSEPSADAASSEPSADAASSVPSAAAASSVPSAAAASSVPSAAAASSVPIAAAASSEPIAAAASSEPIADAASSEPSADAASSEPSADAASSEPSADAASSEPSADAASSEPSADAASSEPSAAAASSEPIADAAFIVPLAERNASMIVEGESMAVGNEPAQEGSRPVVVSFKQVIVGAKPTVVSIQSIAGAGTERLGHSSEIAVVDLGDNNEVMVIAEDNVKQISINTRGDTNSQKINNSVAVLKFYCNDCNKLFDETKFVLHRKYVHEDEFPFKCDKCEYKTNSRPDVVVHFATHRKPPPLKCEFCERRFFTARQKVRHVQRHPESKASSTKPTCAVVGIRHLVTVAPKSTPITITLERENESTNQEQIRTVQAPNEFPVVDLTEKIIRVTEDTKADKDRLDDVTAVLDELVEKVLILQLLEEEPICEDIPRLCEYCGEEFANVHLLSAHIDTDCVVSEDIPRLCENCGQDFTNGRELKAHIKNDCVFTTVVDDSEMRNTVELHDNADMDQLVTSGSLMAQKLVVLTSKNSEVQAGTTNRIDEQSQLEISEKRDLKTMPTATISLSSMNPKIKESENKEGFTSTFFRLKPNLQKDQHDHTEVNKFSVDNNNKEVQETLNDSYVCNLCFQEFSFSASYRLHRHVFHGLVEAFKCNVCEYTTTYDKHLENHVKQAHSPLKTALNPDTEHFKKPSCDEVTPTVEIQPTSDTISDSCTLDIFDNAVQGPCSLENQELSLSSVTTSDILPIETPSMLTTEVSSLNSFHINICDGESTVVSDEIPFLENAKKDVNMKPPEPNCSQYTPPEKRRRMSDTCHEGETESPRQTYLTCKDCGSRFQRRHHEVFAQHRFEAHVDIYPFVCDHCRMWFDDYNALTRHQFSHTGRMQCLYCEKWFPYVHEATLHQEKQHQPEIKMNLLQSQEKVNDKGVTTERPIGYKCL